MKTYQLSPAYYAALKQRMLLTAIPIILAAGVVGYFAGTFQGAGPGYAAVFVVITIIFFAFALPRNYRQQSEIARSYKITLQDNAITRVQTGAQAITISRSDVGRLTEQPGKGIAIFAVNRSQRFGIPATLEGYEELRTTLERWHRIETVTPKGIHWQAIAVPGVALALIILFAVAIISNDKLVVTATGAAALIVSILSAFVLLQSPQVDAKTKSRLWLISIPLLGLIGKIIYTLVG